MPRTVLPNELNVPTHLAIFEMAGENFVGYRDPVELEFKINGVEIDPIEWIESFMERVKASARAEAIIDVRNELNGTNIINKLEDMRSDMGWRIDDLLQDTFPEWRSSSANC